MLAHFMRFVHAIDATHIPRFEEDGPSTHQASVRLRSAESLMCRIENNQIATEPAMPIFRSWALMILIGATAPIFAAETTPFDSRPWIEDLQQIQQAFAEKYANLAVLVGPATRL